MNDENMLERFSGTTVTEVDHEGLKKEFRVKLLDDDVNAEVERQLGELLPRVNIRGFRRGKVPITVLRQREGERLRKEIVTKASLNFAWKEVEKTRPPVERPDVTWPEDNTEYDIVVLYECMPDMPTLDLESIEMTRGIVEDEESLIGFWHDYINLQVSEHEEVDDEYRSEKLDKVFFTGFATSGEINVRLAQGRFLYAGVNSGMIPDHVVTTGLRKGDQLTFSEELEVRGRSDEGIEAEFNIVVEDVQRLPSDTLTDEFISQLGWETREEFREFCLQESKRWIDDHYNERIHRELRETLPGRLDFEMPQEYLDRRVRAMHLMHTNMEGGDIGDEMPDMPPEMVAPYESAERYRLYVRWYAEQHDLVPDPEEMKKYVDARYDRPNQEKEIMLRNLMARATEHNFISDVAKRITCTDKAIDIDELPFPIPMGKRVPAWVWNDDNKDDEHTDTDS